MDHELVATLPGAWLNAARDTSFREMLKALIALGAVGTILFCWLLQVGALKAGRKRLVAALAVLAVLAGAAYVEVGHLRFGHYMNPHDFFHYSVGAKYSPEIGYAGLYRATLVADAEDGATYTDKDRIRDLDT